MKTYEITFRPIPTLTYSYVVDAEDNEEAISKARDDLREAIGYDASKDWEYYDEEEIKEDA
jgi:hypothetical protein